MKAHDQILSSRSHGWEGIPMQNIFQTCTASARAKFTRKFTRITSTSPTEDLAIHILMRLHQTLEMRVRQFGIYTSVKVLTRQQGSQRISNELFLLAHSKTLANIYLILVITFYHSCIRIRLMSTMVLRMFF